MQLSRWNDPFSGLSSLHSQLDDMFNNFLSTAPSAQSIPAMNVYSEDDKQLIAEVDAPGFDKGLLKVTVPFKELPVPKKVAIQSGQKKK